MLSDALKISLGRTSCEENAIEVRCKLDPRLWWALTWFYLIVETAAKQTEVRFENCKISACRSLTVIGGMELFLNMRLAKISRQRPVETSCMRSELHPNQTMNTDVPRLGRALNVQQLL